MLYLVHLVVYGIRTHNVSMKTEKAMEFDSNKEISDNVGVDSEVQKSDRQKRKSALLADYETY